MGANPNNNQGDDLLVENVSWENVQEFLKKSVTDFVCRPKPNGNMPRAGTITAYSFGDSESQLGDHAWFWRQRWRKDAFGRRKEAEPFWSFRQTRQCLGMVLGLGRQQLLCRMPAARDCDGSTRA